MANIEELVHNYHNLAGTFVKDKKKSLRNFMKDVQSKMSSENELDALILAIRPENDREESFMVDVLMHFKKYEQLMSILKQSENPLIIGKILKCWKFFEETFKNVDPDELVNDVLPNTSCWTRMKIINRLSKNLKDEKLADDYFKAIEEKYGLRVATVLLPACSEDLIKNRVEKYNIKLTNRQLMYIVKKRMDFLDFYFDLVHKSDKNFNLSTKYIPVIKYVAKSDVKRFWSLREQHKLHVKFGKNMTTSLLENKKELVKHHENCTDFAKKQIYKIITKNDEDFKEFFLSFYPAKVSEFKSSCLYDNSALTSFLKYVSKPNRYVLMNDYFKNVYGKNLHDDPECATEYSLSVMPRSIREVVLEKKVLEEEELVYMFNTKVSIPAIKDRIKHTSDIETRNKYVSLLYKTCQFNKDEPALLEVFKYLFSRHKNDTFILNSFIGDLENWSGLEKLSDEHWNFINDFVKILEISNTTNNRHYYVNKLRYLEKYLVHLYESNKPIEEHMEELFKYVLETQYSINVFNDNQKYQKLCLEKFGDLIRRTLKGSDLIDWSIRFLASIIGYNERYTGDEISILNYNDMLTYTKTDIAQNYGVQIIVKYCVKKELDGYDLIFWQNYKSLFDRSMLLWYAKNYPYRIIENLHQILANGYPKQNLVAIVFAVNARLPDSKIQNEFIKFINESIQLGDFEKAICSVRALSHLVKCDEFSNSVESLYPPPDGKIDVKENTKKVLLQECIARSLANLKNPSETLTILLKFCQGDYLKYALAPLYAITNRTRETNLPGFFEKLFNSAVSVRKHVVVLTKLLLSQQSIYFLLEQQASKQTHPSMQKVIFKKTLEYFIQNPSEIFWNLLLNNMKIISDEDREAHDDLLVKIGKIPVHYLPQYIPIIYEKFAKNSDKEIAMKKYELLNFISDEVIQKLDVDFLKLIIKDTLFNANITPEQSNFCFKCIFRNSGAAQMKLYKLVVDFFMKHVEENWSTRAGGEIRRTVSSFVSMFCLHSISGSNKTLVESFIPNWSKMFKPEEVIDEYLLLQLTTAYFECDSENFFAEFGPKANDILANLVNRFDLSVVPIYSQALRKFLEEFVSIAGTTAKLYLFIESFMSVNPSRQTYVVACDLLQTFLFVDTELFEKIIERIRNCKDPVVEIHYNHLLKSYT